MDANLVYEHTDPEGQQLSKTISYGVVYDPGIIETFRSVLKTFRHHPPGYGPWSFEIQGDGGQWLKMVISFETIESTTREAIPGVHFFPIPPAPYERDYWERWIIDRILDVHRHEALEFTEIDGVKRYLPYHGDEGNPYHIPKRRG